MVINSRERSVIATFVALSDTLVDDYDVVDFSHEMLVESSATLFDAVSAGLVLASPEGTLEVLASTDEDTRLIELPAARDRRPVRRVLRHRAPRHRAGYARGRRPLGRVPHPLERPGRPGRALRADALAGHHEIGSLNLFQAGTGTC